MSPWPTFWPGYEESMRNNLQTVQVRRDALLTSFLLASPPPKTTRGVKLADSTLGTTSPKATLSPTGTTRRLALKPTPTTRPGHLATPSG